MRALLFGLPLLLSGVFIAQAMQDDEGRRADITDKKGVETFVGGLPSCYEETEDGGIFINKFDNFFVRRGDAVISVRLDSLAEVVFTGKVEETAAERLFEARIKTRAGSETVASIVCHEGGFIKGRVDLGEFQLPLESVKKLSFTGGGGSQWPAVRCFFPDGSAGGPSIDTVRLNLGRDGKMTLTDTGRDLVSFGEEAPDRVVLDLSAEASCRDLMAALGWLARNRVSEVVFSP